MKPPKINLLEDGPGGAGSRRRFSFWKGALIGLGVLVVALPLLFWGVSAKLLGAASKITAGEHKKLSLFEQVRRLVGDSTKELRGQDRDRINILVLGEGGEGHEGAHLTDSLLFVTLKPSTSEVGILSLPRDLWIPLPDGTQNKINAINAFAEMNKARSGGQATANVIGKLLDQPIDYYVRVDFSAYKTLVDDIGGITVNVDQAFTDTSYPTDDELYKTISFRRGWQTMDGETALEYVRSRHGNNGEGSDFARSRRQEKVILGLKDKLVSIDTLLNPSRVSSVLSTLSSHVVTDMELWEVIALAKDMRKVDQSKISHRVLDDGPNGPIYATSIAVGEGSAYVLLPRKGDWSEVQGVADHILDGAPETAVAAAAPAKGDDKPAKEEPVRVEIRNATKQSGLAGKTRDMLTRIGYKVVRIGNATEPPRDDTVIYDLTDGKKPEELQSIRNLLSAQVSLTLPGYLASGITPSNLALQNDAQGNGVDFLVVLGHNAID